MGPSGAGKSTLMDLLAMRTPHDAEAPSAADLTADTRLTITTGTGAAVNGIESSVGGGSWSSQAAQPQPQLLVNGMRMRRRAYMNISAYVPQVSRGLGRCRLAACACVLRLHDLAAGDSRPGRGKECLTCLASGAKPRACDAEDRCEGLRVCCVCFLLAARQPGAHNDGI